MPTQSQQATPLPETLALRASTHSAADTQSSAATANTVPVVFIKPGDSAIVSRQFRIGKIGKWTANGILVAQNRIFNRPLDADRRIVPKYSAIVLGIEKITALVGDKAFFRKNAKAVRETGGNEKLLAVFRGKFHANPFLERR